MEEQPISSDNTTPDKTQSEVPYCFCTLAFGSPYRLAAKKLAQQLHTYGFKLFVATDNLQDFDNVPGAIATHFHRTSVLFPYNDKRFALEIALQHYDCAVLVDADSEISGALPPTLQVPPGMYAGVAYQRSLEEDLRQYHPHNLPKFQRMAQKLGLNLEDTPWICENLIIVRKGEGRERIFLDTWAFADRWLGIRRAFQGDHGYIGLSAAMAGYNVYRHPNFSTLKKVIKNQGHQYLGIQSKVWQPSHVLEKKLSFYWRLVKAYLKTLKEPKRYWL